MAKIVSVVPKLLTTTLGVMSAAPPKPIIIEVPTPSPVTPSPDTPTTDVDTSIAGPNLSDDLDSITARNRGRLGTIATSFRGVLNDTSNSLSRRTLLGE